MSFDFGENEYSFGDVVNFNCTSEQLSPVFSYSLLHFDGDYHFLQDCFDNFDIKTYFNVMHKMSKTPLKDIIGKWGHNDHFHVIANPKNELIKLIAKTTGITENIKMEQMPIVAQVGLYTNAEGADRASGRKSPRIFMLIGDQAILYPFCYDPYHEIYNGPKKKT